MFNKRMYMGFPGGGGSKEPVCQYGRHRDDGSVPGREIPWRRAWQPAPVFLPGESHAQRNLVGYSPWGCKESDMTEQLYLLLHTYIQMGLKTNDSLLFLNISLKHKISKMNGNKAQHYNKRNGNVQGSFS